MEKYSRQTDLEQQEFDTGSQNFDGYGDGYGFDDYPAVPDPVRHPTEIDARLISTSYKDNKILIRKPKYKVMRVAILKRSDKNGKIIVVDGKPIVERMVKANVFDGYDEEEIEFPVKDLHADSVTSSILSDADVDEVRLVDDLVYELGLDTILKKNISYTKTLNRLAGLKKSTVDSAKARGGRAAELSKTNISKGESRYLDMRQEREFEDYMSRRNSKKGVFGLGLWIF